MVLRPVGDLPPGVYWVRRLVVLAVLVLVVVLLWWLWPGGGDSAPTGSQQPSSSPTPTPSATSTPSPSPTESKTKQTPTPTEALCADDDITVTVRTDDSTYPAGVDPSITFTVENDSGKSCVRDVGSAANELRISSGGVTVWSSDYCSSGDDEDLKTLDPGDNYVQTYSWGRVLAPKGCPSPLEQADPGTYEVLALNGEVTSEPAQFVLE